VDLQQATPTAGEAAASQPEQARGEASWEQVPVGATGATAAATNAAPSQYERLYGRDDGDEEPDGGEGRHADGRPTGDSADDAFPELPPGAEREDGMSGDAEGESDDVAAPPSGPQYDESLPDGGTVRRRRLSRDEADDVPDADKDVALALGYKEEGNRHFGAGEYETAVAAYTEALRYIPREPAHDGSRAVFFANRAACHLHTGDAKAALYDCDRAVEANPGYTKALARRAAALERLGKLEEAQKGG
jgi:tetratricopeptide (TPR) repeat protein